MCNHLKGQGLVGRVDRWGLLAFQGFILMHPQPELPRPLVVSHLTFCANLLSPHLIPPHSFCQVDADLPARPGDQLQLVLVEAKGDGAAAAAGPPRFAVTGHFSLTDEEDEEEEEQGNLDG